MDHPPPELKERFEAADEVDVDLPFPVDHGRGYYPYLHTLEMTVPEKLLICDSPLILEILRWILT